MLQGVPEEGPSGRQTRRTRCAELTLPHLPPMTGLYPRLSQHSMLPEPPYPRHAPPPTQRTHLSFIKSGLQQAPLAPPPVRPLPFTRPGCASVSHPAEQEHRRQEAPGLLGQQDNGDRAWWFLACRGAPHTLGLFYSPKWRKSQRQSKPSQRKERSRPEKVSKGTRARLKWGPASTPRPSGLGSTRGEKGQLKDTGVRGGGWGCHKKKSCRQVAGRSKNKVRP